MTYYITEIKRIAKLQNIRLKDLALRVGMTEAGFHQSVKNNSLQFKTVLKICDILNISISDLEERATSKMSDENFKKEMLKSLHFICKKITKLENEIHKSKTSK